MFTGIVEEVGIVRAQSQSGLTVGAVAVLQGTRIGDSIAVNGVCLTVTTLGSGSFSVDVAPETLRRSNLGLLRPGAQVNLERALSLGGRLGGHLVQGHVDGTGKILSMTRKENSILVRIAAPMGVMRYVVEKGFIAVDGMSLTVSEYDRESFTISIIPFTFQNTNLANRRTGDMVNLEVDIIAKYVERLREGASGLTQEFLAEHGFASGTHPPVSLER